MQVKKKIKVNNEVQIPKNIMIKLSNSKNESIGLYEVSLDTGPNQLLSMVRQVIPDDPQFNQFSFFHSSKQIKTKISTFLQQINYSQYEAVFEILYYPMSSFRVKPITRSQNSMYGHTEAVLSVNFSPDATVLASGSGDGTVRLWDINTKTPYKQILADDWVMIVEWSPDGSKLAYAQKNGNITIYNYLEDTSVKLKGHSKWITSLSWQPLHLNNQCDYIVSASKDFSARIWNANSGQCMKSLANHTKCITKVIWSGKNQIFTCSQDQRINCYDNNGNYLFELKRHSHWVNCMSLSTQHLLKKSWFENKQEDLITRKSKALEVYEKAVKEHQQRLVTGSDDFTLMLFKPPNKQPIKVMTGHQQPINHVEFSPDGRYIISASFDKSIKLWDGFNGEFMFTFRGHVGPVYRVAWSPDSRYLISASKDSTIKLWDIKTRKLMFDLPGHADQIYALDWSVNGQLVASGGKDRQVKLWTN